MRGENGDSPLGEAPAVSTRRQRGLRDGLVDALGPSRQSSFSCESAAGGAEASRASFGIGEIAFYPVDGLVFGDDQLGDAIAFFDGVIGAAEVEHDDPNFASVTGVDGAEVDGEGVLESHSAARADLRFISGGKFDGDAGGNALRKAGRKDDGFDGAEIEAGVFRGSVGIDRERGVGVKFLDADLHDGEIAIIAV